MCSANSTRQDLLTYCKILHVCVNNQIESSHITWSATQQSNSKNVERQHLFRQHLCRWFSNPTAPLFALILANTVAGFSSHWIHFEFLVTFQTITLNFFTLHFLSQTFFFKFNLLLPLRQIKTMTKPSPRAHSLMAAKGMGNASPSFISAFPKIEDPNWSPWLACRGRESLVDLTLSWDIGQQGYATHHGSGNNVDAVPSQAVGRHQGNTCHQKKGSPGHNRCFGHWAERGPLH